MNGKSLLAITLLAFTLGSTAQKPVYLDLNAPLEARVADALNRMTVHEKVQLLHAQSKFTSYGVPRLGIKELHLSDGPHGVRAEVDWNSWGSANWTNDSIVAFPALTCLTATWNTEMSALYGKSIGEEFAFRDKHILLGPGTTIARMPLNGRSFEYMGEDPFLAGEMAAPYIKSAQEQGVACCLKHFFLNNQEWDRFGVNVNVSERAVREIYLPAFQKCVQEAGLWTIMGSYNLWKGVHCCQNDELLNKILKDEWGFDGAVVSDWGGVTDTWQAATGGMDIEMGSFTNGKTEDHSMGYNTYNLADPFEKLINEGKIPMQVLNDKAARVLRTIFRTAMSKDRVFGSQCSEAHYAACQQIAEEGIVLLKNDKIKMLKNVKVNASILPLKPELQQTKGLRILVVGENATRSLTEGGGSSELKTKFDISPLEGLKKVYGDAIDYAQGYYSGRALYDNVDKLDPAKMQALHDEAVEKAKHADVVIYVGGLNKNTKQDCEANDREEYNLSFGQDVLISDLTKVQPNIVVVTFGGNPYAMPWLKDVKALLHCWYLGSMGGTALANVICGEVNPSGKLPVTFAVNKDDYPCFHYGAEGYPGIKNDVKKGDNVSAKSEVYYKEGIYVGYRYFDTNNVKPQFPFGFGMSYTSFKYGKPSIVATDNGWTVSASVTNSGQTAGKEVVQLYIGDEKASVDRPKKELKGFQKVSLAPGETKVVSISFNRHALEFYDEASHAWKAEPGRFKAYVCASETDVRGTVGFELK